MIKKYQAWIHKIEPMACSLYHFEGFDKSYLLNEGIKVKEQYPENVYFDMHPDRTKDNLLVDSLFNTDNELVISKKMMIFFVDKKIKNLEFLPVKIRDHQAKFIDEEYFILNILDHQDCLDIDASCAEISIIDDTTIEEVEEIILLDDKADHGLDIFRICNFPAATLISDSLVKEMQNENFTGIDFISLEEFDGM